MTDLSAIPPAEMSLAERIDEKVRQYTFARDFGYTLMAERLYGEMRELMREWGRTSA